MTGTDPAAKISGPDSHAAAHRNLLEVLSPLFAIRRLHVVQRIAIALILVFLATWARLAFFSELSGRSAYIPFHIAVVLAAVFIGPAGCAAATIAALVITHSIFFPIRDVDDVAIAATFAATATLLSALIELLITTQRHILVAQQRQERDAHLRLFIDQAPVAIAMFDNDMRYLAASRRWHQYYGLGDIDLIGRCHYDVFPNLPPEFRSFHDQGFAGQSLHSLTDAEIRLPNGQTRWDRWEIHPWRHSDGQIGGITIFTEDVAAERSLRENKDHLKRAQGVARVASWRMDFAADELKGTSQTFDLLGQTPDARLDYASLLAIVHEDDRAVVDEARQSVAQGQPYDIEYRFTVDGGERWMHERSEPEINAAGKIIGAFGVIQDVTDRKAIEKSLAASEERLRLALEAAGMAVWDLDLRTGDDVWNDQSYRMIGYQPGEISPNFESWSRHIHPDDRDRVTRNFLQSLQSESDLANENRMIDRHGNIRWVSARGRTAVDAQGRPMRSYGVITDITERKQAEERDRLLSSELHHRAKNLLAVVQAVALQTARYCSPEQFVGVFDQRLKSLAASHDLLVSSKWHSVEFSALVHAQLSHFADLFGTRITLVAEKAELTADAAQAIGLALHELVTNAAKYGALSSTEGNITIGCSIAETPEGPRVHIRWKEHGGPAVSQPVRRGLGHSVLMNMAPYSLGATVDMRYDPEGVLWELDAPANLILKPASPAR
jgi:PAS domain S-box-containing protein